MPGHSEPQLVLVDAGTVVANTYQRLTTGNHVDDDVGRARVQTVLDQFLDDGSRPLDDLAGSDLVNEMVWKLEYGHRRAEGSNKPAILSNRY